MMKKIEIAEEKGKKLVKHDGERILAWEVIVMFKYREEVKNKKRT